MQAKLETVKKHMSGKRFAAAKGTPSLCDTLAPSALDARSAGLRCYAAEFETDNRELMEEPDVSDTASSGQDQEEVSQAFAPCVPLHTYASTLLRR